MRNHDHPLAALPGRLVSALAVFCASIIAFAPTKTAAAPGELDLTFGNGGKVVTRLGGDMDIAYGIAIQADGKIVVAGRSGGWNGSLQRNTSSFAVVRYQVDGTLDGSFGNGGKVVTPVGSLAEAKGIAIQADGRVVVAGFADVNSTSEIRVVRYNTDGSLDSGFGSGGIVRTAVGSGSVATSVAIQSDGKVLVAGSSSGSDQRPHFTLVRYSPDGSLDPGFDGDGVVTTPIGLYDLAYALVLQGDGKIIAAGEAASDFALVRYTVDGKLDSSFGTNGTVLTDFLYGSDNVFSQGDDAGLSVAIQSDGKIVVVGRTRSEVAIARYAENGSLDLAFGSGGKLIPSDRGGESVFVQEDGKILTAGSTLLARYNIDGSSDPTFGVGGFVDTKFGEGDFVCSHAMALQPDGRIVVAGESGINFDSDGRTFGIARFEGDFPIPLVRRRSHRSRTVNAMISKSAARSFVGQNAWNRNGENQTLRAKAAAGTQKTFFVKVRNTGATVANFTVAGTGATAGFAIRYFDASGAEITTEIVAGAYRIDSFAPGAEQLLRVAIQTRANLPHGAARTCRITASRADAADSEDADTVRGRVIVW